MARSISLVAFPEGHGLHVEDASALLMGIRSFYGKAVRENYHTVVGAYGMCQDASDEFLKELSDVHGFRGGVIEHYDFVTGASVLISNSPAAWMREERVPAKQVKRDLARYPFPVHNEPVKDGAWQRHDVCEWHWAVRVGHVIVDWTARQFDRKAAFPALWVDKTPFTEIQLECLGDWAKKYQPAVGARVIEPPVRATASRRRRRSV